MKKILLSLMAVVCALSMSAAEWSIDFSEIGTRLGLADKAGATIGAAVDGGMGNVTLGDEALNSNFGIQTGTTWLYRTAQKALYSQNGGGRNFGVFNAKKKQLITLDISAAPTPTNATLKSTNGNVRVYEVTADGTVTFNLARYNYIYTISVADPSATDVEYTVKYVDEEGIELKASSTNSGAPGAAITVGDVEKASFVAEGQKYIYKSDDAADKTIAADGTTVVTVTFRKAASYTLFAKYNGNVISSAAVYEGDNGNVYVPYYQLVDGKLYGTPTVDKGTLSYGQVTVSNVTADVDVNVSYTEDATQNAVFFAEAENISTLKAYEDGYTNIRMSNGAVAYAQADGAVIVNLPAGKYTVTSASRAGTTDFYAGTTQVLEVVSTGSVVTTTGAEFTLTKSTDITVSAGSTLAYFDYVLIRKTGEYVAPDNTVAAGKYIAQVTIAEAEGVAVPAEFQAYVGTHKYGMDLAGDEKKLTISGMSIMNNMEIVGDAVAYDATKTFTMNGKEFTICSVDGTKTEGELAVTKNEDGSISIEDFGFMKGGKFAGTAKNITAYVPEYVEAEANITFEDVDLQGKTYYDGSDGDGLIATAEKFSFMNYNPGGYWYGFGVSATRSDIYTGIYKDDSQFNSVVAGGMQSEKFAVCYYNEYQAINSDEYPEIYAEDNIKPEYAYITNTAYAVKSMTEGDTFSKKFDETDWLKLTIIGLDNEDKKTGEPVEFYLAKDGNIVTEWTKVDLTSLGVCSHIRFTMDSSDKSYGYMNTPAYFALDNMKAAITDEPTTAVKGVANVQKAAQKVQKLMKDGQILIKTANGIVNAAGAQVK